MTVRLTSKDMAKAPKWVDDECQHGYRDGFQADAVEPGPNRHPAYVHGFRNAMRDRRLLPAITMHEIVSAWNYIVAQDHTP